MKLVELVINALFHMSSWKWTHAHTVTSHYCGHRAILTKQGAHQQPDQGQHTCVSGVKILLECCNKL